MVICNPGGEQQYRLFVQNFQGIVYQGRMDFVPIFFHGAVERITGYTEDEFTSGTPRWDQIIHPEDRAMVLETGRKLRTTPDFATEREYRILRKDGQTGWVYEQIQNVCDDSGKPCLVQGAIYDITERKRMEEELRRLNEHLDQQVAHRTAELTQTVDRLYHEVSRRILAEGTLRKRSQMLEAFFEHTIAPMAFMNWCFDFVRVNEAYAKSSGKDPEYFVGRNYFALYPDAQTQAIFERVVRTHQPYRAYATPLQRAEDPQQVITYWNWQLTPLLNERDGVLFVVLNLQDVTEQQTALQESQEHARRLQQLALELSQAEDRERHRLAEILHDDLQQTLAAAKFHLALLDRRMADDAELHELAGVTNGLLTQAIETSRSLSHELHPPALSDENLCETFKWLAWQMQSKHGLAVRLDLCESFVADLGELGRVETPGKRIVLRSEPLKAFLYKAAQEMLFNVIKHANTREATMRLRHRRGHIYLSVSDKGRGFDPSRLVKGDGFGLLSVRERVKLLGGRMKIKSARGKGSIFLLAVPDSAPESV